MNAWDCYIKDQERESEFRRVCKDVFRLKLKRIYDIENSVNYEENFIW